LEEIDGALKVIERRVPYDIESTIETAKNSEIYLKGTVWCELCFLALRTGLDYFGVFFETAQKIADAKDESAPPFSNGTWAEAYEASFDTFPQNRTCISPRCVVI